MPTPEQIADAVEAIARGADAFSAIPTAQDIINSAPNMINAVPAIDPVITQDVTKNDNLILSMRMQRSREGIKFFVKSEAIEDFIKTASKGRTNDEQSTWDFQRYKETGLAQFTLPGTTFNEWGGSMYVRGTMVNLSFLRVVGLKNGIEFLLNEMTTKEKLERFTNDFKNCVKQFYREFMKPFDIQIDITVEQTRTPEMPVQTTETRNEYPVTDNIAQYIRSNNMMGAIAEFRRMYGITLAEAKTLTSEASDRINGGQIR